MQSNKSEKDVISSLIEEIKSKPEIEEGVDK